MKRSGVVKPRLFPQCPQHTLPGLWTLVCVQPPLVPLKVDVGPRKGGRVGAASPDALALRQHRAASMQPSLEQGGASHTGLVSGPGTPKSEGGVTVAPHPTTIPHRDRLLSPDQDPEDRET